MALSRKEICSHTSARLAAAARSLSSIGATVGFDGFVDEIIGVIDKWLTPVKYQLVPDIATLAGKINRAVGQSSNYELLVKQMKLGGNGPIMANALAAMGLGVTYIGNLGYPTMHPVFQELADRAKAVYSIAEPGHTDALEFADGKLMLGKLSTLKDVNWKTLIARVGLKKLRELAGRSSLLAMANWTMLPAMSDIWMKMLKDVLPAAQRGKLRIFVDLADPEKRTEEDIAKALRILGQLQKRLDVTLGLNLKEAGEIAEVLKVGHAIPAEQGFAQMAGQIEAQAQAIRSAMRIDCVVIHPRHGAAAATPAQTASFAGPFVKQPKLSTGAGDHFNAGFAAGQVLGMELPQCLCVGVATSGYYVRNAKSPAAKDLAAFIAKLPQPEE